MRALTCSHGRAPVCDLPLEPTPLRGPHSAWCVSARGQCYRSQGATCLRASEHSEIRTASAAMKVKVYFRELPVPESRVASTHRPGCRVSPGDSLYRKKPLVMETKGRGDRVGDGGLWSLVARSGSGVSMASSPLVPRPWGPSASIGLVRHVKKIGHLPDLVS